MSKKKTSSSPTTSRPKVTRQSAVSAHELEFAEAIMAPKFLELLYDHDFDLTYTTMTTVYNNRHNTRLSASSIKKYLDLLGWKYQRKPTWTGIPTTIGDTTNTVDTAAILHGPDDDPTLGSPIAEGHTMGVELPGQGKLSREEMGLIG